MSNFDKDALKMLVGGVVGANVLGGDETSLSTFLGIGAGVSVAMLGDFNFTDDMKNKGLRQATNNIVKSIDSESVVNTSKTKDDKINELLTKAKKYADNNTSSHTTLDKDDILGSLNRNTIDEYEKYTSSLNEESINAHKILLNNEKDIFYNPKDGINSGINMNETTRINADADESTRRMVLSQELEKLGYTQGTKKHDMKMARLEGLVQIEDTPIEFKDGTMTINNNVRVNITSSAVGENGVLTPFHVNNGNVYDVRSINPFADSVLKGNNVNAIALTPEVMDTYKVQELLLKSQGLAPDDAIGLAQKYLEHLEPKDQIKALSKVAEQFNSNYSYNSESTGLYKDQLGNGIKNPTITPSAYSGYRSSVVEYGDTFNFVGDTGRLSTDKPVRKLETTSRDGISRPESRRLFQKIAERDNMTSLAGRKGDDATALPSKQLSVLDSNTGRINVIDNPYNNVINSQGDSGRDVGVVGLRSDSVKGNSETNKVAKEIYKRYGTENQYGTSVAVRSTTIDPERKVGSTTFGNIITSIFGSNTTTGDGFGLLSQDAAKGFEREGYESVHASSLKANGEGVFSIMSDNHREILKGSMTPQELQQQAETALTSFNLRDDNTLNKALTTLEKIKDIKANTSSQDEFIQELNKLNLFDNNVLTKLKGDSNKLNTYLDRTIFGRSRNNPFIRGNSSNSYKEAVAKVSDEKSSIIKRLRSLSVSDIDTAHSELNDIYRTYGGKSNTQQALHDFYLVPNSVLGYNGDGSPVKVPNNYNNYTLSNISLRGSFDSSGNANFNQVDFSLKGKLEADKLDFLKLFGLSSKAQVGLESQDTVSKILLLDEFSREGKLKVDENKKRLTFKLENDKHNSAHKNFIDGMNSIDQTRAPILTDVLTKRSLNKNNLQIARQEAKNIGLDKEFEELLKPHIKKLTDPNIKGTTFKILEPEYKYKAVSISSFKNNSVESIFSENAIQRVVNKIPGTKAITKNVKVNPRSNNTSLGKELASGLSPVLEQMYSQPLGDKVSNALAKVLDTTFNTSYNVLRGNSTESAEKVLSRHVADSLSQELGSGTIPRQIGSLLGSAIGTSIGSSYAGIPASNAQQTLGYALDVGYGNKLGQQLSNSLNTVLNTNSNTQGKNIGESIASVIGKNKIDNSTIAKSFTKKVTVQPSTPSTYNVSFNSITRVNKEIEGRMSRYNGIDLIMDEDSTGGAKFRNIANLFEQHNRPSFDSELKAEIPSTVLRRGVTDQLNTRGSDLSVREGLSSFVLSFANKEKGAFDILPTALVNVKSRTTELVNNHLSDPTDKKTLGALDSFVQNMTGKSVVDSSGNVLPDVEKVVNQHINDEMDFVRSHYTSTSDISTNLHALSKDPSRLKRLTDFYINARQNAHLGRGNVTEVGMSQNPVGVANLGSTRNTISWMTSKQLRDNGFSLDELNLFGRVNSNTAADHEIVTMLTNKVHNPINDQLDTPIKKSSLNKALNLPSNERRASLRKDGINIDGLVGSYRLQHKTSNGFEQVPIILEDTNLFGNFMKEGQVSNKRVATLFNRMILTDQQIGEAGSEAEKSMLIKRQEAYTDEIKEHIKPVLGGKDNLGKKLLTRDAVNSVYSRALPVTGTLEAYGARTGEPSVASVSTVGIRHRLQEVDKDLLGGVDINQLSDEELYKQNFFKKTKEGLYEVELEHKGVKVPFFAALTREPSAGPGSTAMTRVLADPSSKAGKGYINTVSNSRFNKYYKFLDFDADQMLEAYPEYKVKNIDTIQSAWDKGQRINKKLESLDEFTEHLGVKGRKNGTTSFLDILDKGDVKTEQDFHKALIKEASSSAEKGTIRGVVAPSVTKASQQILEAVSGAVNNSTSIGDESTTLRSKILSHYLTENLIKTMHTSTDDYNAKPVTLAERLGNHLNSNNIHAFNTELEQYVEDTLIKNNLSKIKDDKKRARLEADTREAVSNIKNAMLQRDPDRNISTPVDLKPRKTFEQATEDYQKLTGAHIANPTLSIEEKGDEGVVHTAKKGYYTAKEVLSQNFKKNRNLLIGAGAIVGAGTLLTQKKPDFGENKAHANTNGMLLSSGKTALEESSSDIDIRNSNHPATEYLYKFGGGRKQTTIDAERTDNALGDEYQDMTNAITGGNMSSVRVLTN